MVPGLDHYGMSHDGSEGVSPEVWLPDRVSVGALTKTFPPELVDQIIATTGTREVRRRLLPARLMVYFVLALWLFTRLAPHAPVWALATLIAGGRLLPAARSG